MDDDFAQFLLAKTIRDYNLIAEHFSNTRDFIWSDLKDLVRFCEDGDRVLDLGCGSGRLIELFRDREIEYVGVDSSDKLIRIAKNKFQVLGSRFQVSSSKFIVADALNLPFPDNSFDKVFSIAVFHHIPSEKLRIRFLQEVKRVLKPNGLLILTAWNLCQPRFLKYHLQYTFSKLIGKSILSQIQDCPEPSRRAKLDFKDIFYPWKNQKGEIIIQRYVHCFTKNELRRLASKTSFTIREIGFLDGKKRNLYLVAYI